MLHVYTFLLWCLVTSLPETIAYKLKLFSDLLVHMEYLC